MVINSLPQPELTLVNVLHSLIILIALFGSIILPLKCMPLVIIQNVCILFRFHDYCWMSRLSTLLNDNTNDEPHKSSFAVEMTHAMGLYDLRDYLVENIRVVRNIATFLFAVNIFIACYRLALAYRIPIFPSYKVKITTLCLISVWMVSEIMFIIYEVEN